MPGVLAYGGNQVFLTRAELIELIGSERPSAARRWLDRHGIPHMDGIDGWPRVLKSAILARLSETPNAAPQPKLRLA